MVQIQKFCIILFSVEQLATLEIQIYYKINCKIFIQFSKKHLCFKNLRMASSKFTRRFNYQCRTSNCTMENSSSQSQKQVFNSVLLNRCILNHN